MKIKITSRFYITQARRAKINRQMTAQTCKDGGKGKGNITPVRVGVQTATTSMEIGAKVPREVNTRSTARSSYSALGVYMQRTLSHYRDACSLTFTATLLTITRDWK